MNSDADVLLPRPTIRKIEIKNEADDYPDLSYIGTLTDEYTEGILDLHEERITTTSWSPRYFVPAYSEAERIKDMSEGATRRPESAIKTIAHQAVIDDAKRILHHGEDWYLMGITAEAEVVYETDPGTFRISKFSSGGIWGVESDGEPGYLNELKNEELADLRRHLERFNVDTSDFNKLACEVMEEYHPWEKII